MRNTIGPLDEKEAFILHDFLTLLRGAKIRKGEEISVPCNVLRFAHPGVLGRVLPIRPAVLAGKFYATRAFRVHGVTTEGSYEDRLIHVDLGYEDGEELCGDKQDVPMPHEIPRSTPVDGGEDGEILTGECKQADDHKVLSGSSPSPKSTQVGGDHYSKMKIQPIDFITENGLGYIEGNIIKYVCRYKDKNGLEDLKKAQHYLQMLIEQTSQDQKTR